MWARIATRYRVDGSRDQIAFGARFSATDHTGPPGILYNGYRVFPGGKAAGTLLSSPTPTSAEVKERIDLYR
jgi:hypothetical protein